MESIIAADPFPMPRYWFIAADEINLIQIQKDAFMFNWRRREGKYPRFHSNIKPIFDKYYDLFSDFIQTEFSITELPISLCELTYVNVIESCDYWAGPQDTSKVIPSFSIIAPDIDDSAAKEFNCNYVCRSPSDLQLNIGIRSGVKNQQKDAPFLIFEIRAYGRFEQIVKQGTDKWFERAHNAIIRCFLNITNQDIQNQFWKPVEGVS